MLWYTSSIELVKFCLTSSHSNSQFWFCLWFKIEMFALNIAGGWTIVNYTRWCGHVQQESDIK